MRTSFALLAAAGIAMSQDLASLPECGQTCITNMLSIANSGFGCGAGDVVCYCSNQDFGYGVRDCSNQACSSPEEAARVIQYGTDYCASALSGASSTGALPILTSALSSIATETGEGQTATPITTSALVETITTDGSTVETTTGFTTIYNSMSSAAASVTESAESMASSAASSATDAISSIESAASSAIESAESGASSVASSVSEAASSATQAPEGAAPMMTAFPMAGAVGIAAMLLI
ncbi:hypothetical protein M011DRAFT_466276 [Sporormia fimetaria CBS 119925]|uniref:CFEM domain-containing protein n=1 Tax=Sporormia fimetaria CBS 119925 TaxID=1340428 RepID=A0A6A6VJ66_9PLEO|nr:hypothetical protein M011DRAFT_466276 [Sporormia fimetaria CBS 119925]